MCYRDRFYNRLLRSSESDSNSDSDSSLSSASHAHQPPPEPSRQLQESSDDEDLELKSSEEFVAQEIPTKKAPSSPRNHHRCRRTRMCHHPMMMMKSMTLMMTS